MLKNNRLKLCLLAGLMCSLSACAGMTKQEQRVAKGAAAGAVLGSVLTGGDMGAVLGGAALGGIAGEQYDKRQKQQKK